MFKLIKKFFLSLVLSLEEESTVNDNTDPADSEGNDPTPPESDTQEVYEIDGEQLTIDQLREFKKGYMRQSDYTKKTTALAQEKAKALSAIEFYEKYKENPDIVKKLDPKDPTGKDAGTILSDPRIDILSHEMFSMRLEQEADAILQKDPDAPILDILELAKEKKIGITDAYFMYKGQNYDSSIEEAVKKRGADLTEEIKKKGITTVTVIKPGEKKISKPVLSPEQKKFAERIGMTEEDYAKYGSAKFNPFGTKKK